MIKILDDNGEFRNKIFFCECSRCTTKFTYQYEDTHRDLFDFFENDGDRHVVCPFCGSREWANYKIYMQDSDNFVVSEKYKEIFKNVLDAKHAIKNNEIENANRYLKNALNCLYSYVNEQMYSKSFNNETEKETQND